MCDECKTEDDRCAHSRSDLSHGMGNIKTALTGVAIVKSVKKFALLGIGPRSLIDVVEAGKFPAASWSIQKGSESVRFPNPLACL